MRRFLCVLLLALAAVIAAPGGAQATSRDVAAGTGTIIGFGDPMVHLNAQAEEDTPPFAGRGHFFVRYPVDSLPDRAGLEIHGKITCVNAVGVDAVAAGIVTKVTGQDPFNLVEGMSTVQVRARDTGSPGTLDGSNWGPAPPDCSSPPGSLPISQGNYVVHDSALSGVFAGLDLLIAEFEAAAGPH
jgi:hypothetical protein